MSRDPLDAVREGCARVVERAASVRIDRESLEKLASELATARPSAPEPDPAHRLFSDPASTLAYVVTLDALNFGSGWFPVLRKRPGLSGYFTVATSLREQFERSGPWSAAELADLDAHECARVFGQEAGSEAFELMELFAGALRDLGRWLGERFGGRFAGPLEAAGGLAARLVPLLVEMPMYRDVARYGDLEVPFYKRAQLTAADLSLAFGGEGPGRFDDLARLTCFADNLVPHVLRCLGVLVYAPPLLARIEAGELLPCGSPEEVEIRASGVFAVELCAEAVRRAGGRLRPFEIDHLLWTRGQRPEIKAHPRHRTRTSFY